MKKITSLFVLLLLFVQFTGFVLAWDTLPTPVEPRERNQATDEELRAFAEQREWKDFLFDLSLVIDTLISLGLGILISKKMIKKNPKITNLIIHAIIFLGTLVVFIITLVDGTSCLLRSCGFPTFLYPFIILASLISIILSSIIIREIVKKKEGNKYKINLSASIFFVWVIFTILTIISETILWFPMDLPVFLFLPIISFPIMLVFYFVLGIIGRFIDRHKNKF